MHCASLIRPSHRRLALRLAKWAVCGALAVAFLLPRAASAESEALLRGLMALRVEQHHAAQREFLAVVAAEDRPGGNQAELTRALSELASVKLVLGDVREAVRLSERALRAARELQPESPLLLGNALRVAGEIELEIGRSISAIQSCGRAVDLLADARHIDTAALSRALLCAGRADISWDQYRRGVQRLQRAKQIADNDRIGDPSARFIARIALAVFMRELRGVQEYAGEQRALTEEAEQICRTEIPAPSLCQIEILGLALDGAVEMGMIEEGRRLIESAERMIVRLYGQDHYWLASAHAGRSALAATSGNCDLALTEGEMAVRILQANFGSENGQIIAPRGLIAHCLFRLGRRVEAAARQREVIALTRRFTPPVGGRSLALYLRQYANTQLSLGRVAEADRATREAVQIERAYATYMREQAAPALSR